MTVYKWSQTAASNSNVDSTINWAEGQAPSSVNDSARALMAAVAKYRDDLAGAITTGGSATAYTVTSNQSFNSLANLSGKAVAFVPHTTNGATVTLNVDGLGAKPLRSAPSTELGAGVLVQGTPYVAVYNNSTAEWILHGFYGNAYNIPLGGLLPYVGTTAPNSNFVLPHGQAISRTTYATLFSLVSTTFGTGDGSTTFNVPDLRGRLLAGKDDMGGSAASRITTAGSSIDGATLGAAGGAQTVTLAANQIPALSGTTDSTTPNLPGGSLRSITNAVASTEVYCHADEQTAGTNQTSGWTNNMAHTHAFAIPNASQQAVNKMPPTMIVNYILRVL